MTTDDLIRELCSWVQTLPPTEGEKALQVQVIEKLKALNQRCDDRGAILNPAANGVSRPDVLVTSVDPQLLIELKVDGEWRSVAEAAWQLFQAGELLLKADIPTRKLAIFGGKIADPLLWGMLAALNTKAVCIQH